VSALLAVNQRERPNITAAPRILEPSNGWEGSGQLDEKRRTLMHLPGVQLGVGTPEARDGGLGGLPDESSLELDPEELRRQNEELRSEIQELRRIAGVDGLSISDAPPSYRTDQSRSSQDGEE
jgi:hypothetical protein